MVYLAVCELKSPSMSDFLWGLENSGWLRHIKAIMDAGIFIAKVCICRAEKRSSRPASTLWLQSLDPSPPHQPPCAGLCCTEWAVALQTSARFALWRWVLRKTGQCSVNSMLARQSSGKIFSEYFLHLGLVLVGGKNFPKGSTSKCKSLQWQRPEASILVNRTSFLMVA